MMKLASPALRSPGACSSSSWSSSSWSSRLQSSSGWRSYVVTMLVGIFLASAVCAQQGPAPAAEPILTLDRDGTTSPEPDESLSPFEGLVFYCTKCKKEVPESNGAGSSCPHCGAYFRTATNADGSDSQVDPTVAEYPMRFWGPVLLVLIFGGEYAYRKWKKSKRS